MEQLYEIEDEIEDFETLSRNHNITLEYIFEYEDKSWCWFEISKRQDLSEELLITHMNTPLNFYLILLHNPNISKEFISQIKHRIIVDYEDYVEELGYVDKEDVVNVLSKLI